MDKLLQDANIAVQTSSPRSLSEESITVFRQDKFLQLTFQTTGCRFNTRGSCSMCNYGRGKRPDPSSIYKELGIILKDARNNQIQSILLGASGSFLDPGEIPEPLQNLIFETVFQSKIPQIIIETHYKSISEKTLRRIADHLPGRSIELEVGLETANQWLRTHILNKEIDTAQFEKMIDTAHRFHITVTINLLFGLPFLSKASQLADAKASIQWAISRTVDYIMVFPVNIHPYTLFEWLYEKKQVQPASLWLLVRLLTELDDSQLDHLSVAWYGNRFLHYENGRETVPPYACEDCRHALTAFFDDFYQNRVTRHRREKLGQLLKTPFPCACRESVFRTSLGEATFFMDEYKSVRKEMEVLIASHGVT